MKKKSNDIEINIEIIPVYTFFGRKNIIKISDFAYGEWLIYKSNKPFYYINIFHSDFKELKTLLESKKQVLIILLGRLMLLTMNCCH